VTDICFHSSGVDMSETRQEMTTTQARWQEVQQIQCLPQLNGRFYYPVSSSTAVSRVRQTFTWTKPRTFLVEANV